MRTLWAALLFTAALPTAVLAQSDADGDGVANSLDAYPCDATASGTAYAPSEGGHGTLLFEDQWPIDGDLDFNDVVVTYNYVFRTNAAGQVTSLRATFNGLAVGGANDNGLGLVLPVARSAASSVTRRVGSGAAQALTPAADGQLTVTLSSNLRELFANQSGPLNSRTTELRSDGSLITLDVTFAAPVSLTIGLAPFDLFVFRSSDAGHQIHRPEFAGTAAMDTALFGTGDDASTAQRHFVDRAGLPFVLILPVADSYPAEATAISQLFPAIVDFAQSGGTSDQDFYARDVRAAFAYRDTQGRPPLTPTLLAVGAADTSCIVAASIVSWTHLDFLTVAEGGITDSYQISDLAVDWDRNRAYFLRSNNDPTVAIIRSFPVSTMVEDQQARMSSITAVTPNNFPMTLHSDGDGYLYVVPGSSNSRPIIRIDSNTWSETGRFGVSSSGLSNTTGRLVATTWMASVQSGATGYLITGSLFNDVAILRSSDMSYVWGSGQTIPESRVRGVVAGGAGDGWILGSNRGTAHTGLALYHVSLGATPGVTRVAAFAPGELQAGATAYYDEAGGLTYDASDGGVIFQVRMASGSGAGSVHTVKWRNGAIVWNVITPWAINYEGPFESQNRLVRGRWTQMRASRVIQLDTATGATLLDQTLPFSEGGAQTYDSVSNRLIVKTSEGWTRIQFAP